MKKKKEISLFLKKTLMTLVVTLSISIIGYTIQYYRDISLSKNTIINSLYTDGKKLKDTIEKDFINRLFYELKIYSSFDGLKELDKDKISKFLTFVNANNERYVNMAVISTSREIVYGYLPQEKQKTIYSIIDNVVANGMQSINLSKGTDKYHLDVFIPIENGSKTVGIMFFEISTQEIDEITASIRDKDGVEAYVVDKNGVFITSSRFSQDVIAKEKIDIKRVKLNIDYAKDIPYKDYRGEKVYGRYFPLNFDGCTLIIEADESPTVINSVAKKTLPQIIVVLQGTGIVLLQLLFKNKFGIEVEGTSMEEILVKFKKGEIPLEDINKMIDKINKNNNPQS